MNYKGYIAYIYFDEEDGCFCGDVINTKDIISFEGNTVEELRNNFYETVEDYIELCRERGEDPEKPFSGEIRLRIDPALHRKLLMAAKNHNTSMNKLIENMLREELERTHSTS